MTDVPGRQSRAERMFAANYDRMNVSVERR
jgi:hypothetical protein